jgi:hypothetical protein
MTLLGKTMLNLDGALAVLSPQLDPVQLIRNYMLDVMVKRVGDQFSPGRVFAWVLDMKHLLENSPRRVDTILGKLADDRLTVHMELDRLDQTTQTLSRAATRLAAHAHRYRRLEPGVDATSPWPMTERSPTQLSGGSPREGARSAAEQRLAAGGRRLPRPVLSKEIK